MEQIFVYGSLRRGGHNDIQRLFPAACFISAGWMQGWLYDLGSYPGLALVGGSGPATRICGELFAVDAHTLHALDQFESVNNADPFQGDYWRRAVAVSINTGSSVWAWVYECNPARWSLDRPISSGDWLTWSQAQQQHSDHPSA